MFGAPGLLLSIAAIPKIPALGERGGGRGDSAFHHSSWRLAVTVVMARAVSGVYHNRENLPSGFLHRRSLKALPITNSCQCRGRLALLSPWLLQYFSDSFRLVSHTSKQSFSSELQSQKATSTDPSYLEHWAIVSNCLMVQHVHHLQLDTNLVSFSSIHNTSIESHFPCFERYQQPCWQPFTHSNSRGLG